MTGEVMLECSARECGTHRDDGRRGWHGGSVGGRRGARSDVSSAFREFFTVLKTACVCSAGKVIPGVGSETACDGDCLPHKVHRIQGSDF